MGFGEKNIGNTYSVQKMQGSEEAKDSCHEVVCKAMVCKAMRWFAKP